MRAFFSLQQLANAVWNLVVVASRTVEVNTKTGFSLTAGSYQVRASSTQRGTITGSGTSTTGAVSSVTTTRAFEVRNGNTSTIVDGNLAEGITRLTLTNATTVTAAKNTGTVTASTDFAVEELL